MILLKGGQSFFVLSLNVLKSLLPLDLSNSGVAVVLLIPALLLLLLLLLNLHALAEFLLELELLFLLLLLLHLEFGLGVEDSVEVPGGIVLGGLVSVGVQDLDLGACNLVLLLLEDEGLGLTEATNDSDHSVDCQSNDNHTNDGDKGDAHGLETLLGILGQLLLLLELGALSYDLLLESLLLHLVVSLGLSVACVVLGGLGDDLDAVKYARGAGAALSVFGKVLSGAGLHVENSVWGGSGASRVASALRRASGGSARGATSSGGSWSVYDDWLVADSDNYSVLDDLVGLHGRVNDWGSQVHLVLGEKLYLLQSGLLELDWVIKGREDVVGNDEGTFVDAHNLDF